MSTTTLLLALALLATAEDPRPDATPQLTLEATLERVRAANPDLAEADARAAGAEARASAAGRLPPPMANLAIWNPPIARPLAFDEANHTMIGLRQDIPLPPKLSLRRKSQRAAAGAARAERLDSWSEVRGEATRTFVELWRVRRERDNHLEHVRIAKQALKTAEGQYAAGQGRQHDVLRAGLETARLHADIASIDQRIATAEAAMRALMDLPREAPLGAPTLAASMPVIPELATLEARIAKSRAAVVAAESSRDAAAAEVRLARAERWLPDISIGAEYWANPMERDGYAAMLMFTVPWFSGMRRDQERAASADLAAAIAARRAVVNGATAELRDAHARAIAAAKVDAIYRDDIIPKAENARAATLTAYLGGGGALLELLDADRSLLDARLAADRARADAVAAHADLEVALGEPLVPETAAAEGAAR